jgi:hypothetical protein
MKNKQLFIILRFHDIAIKNKQYKVFYNQFFVFLINEAF